MGNQLTGLAQEQDMTSFLCHVKTIRLPSTSGSVTLAKARRVFTGGVDSSFNRLDTDVKGNDTAPADVDVYKVTHNGELTKLFRSFGDPHSLCLTQGQIVHFCQKYCDTSTTECYEPAFLFKVGDKLFVAFAMVKGGELTLVMMPSYDDDYTFTFIANGHRCLVVPKQSGN